MWQQGNSVEVSRRKGTFQGVSGTFIIEARLTFTKDLPPIPPEIANTMKKPIKSLGDEIRNHKSEWLFPQEITNGEPVTITLEQIQKWFADIDLDTVLLGVSWTFISDHYEQRSDSLFPSGWQPSIYPSMTSEQNTLEESMERLRKWQNGNEA